jgi:hypothetical protein
MPLRKKPKPVKSTELQPSGDGILEGVHYDPFEPSTFGLEGFVPGFESLGGLCTLASGPNLLDGQVFRYHNPEDKCVRLAGELVVDQPLTAVTWSNTRKRGQISFIRKSSTVWLIDLDVQPKDLCEFKVFISTYGPAETKGKFTLTPTFL